MGTTTDPIEILDEIPKHSSIMIQTLPPVEETEYNDPHPLACPDEPIRFGCDSDSDDNKSINSQSS